VHTGDANILMNDLLKAQKCFDFIDLDPYGSGIPFMDSALNLIYDGGLIGVTFTDLAVLCGKRSPVCFYKYGSLSNNKPSCHEVYYVNRTH